MKTRGPVQSEREDQERQDNQTCGDPGHQPWARIAGLGVSPGHADLLSRVKQVLAHHQPRYVYKREGEVDSKRDPICSGCEVNYWPCTTVRLLDGTWGSIPK